MIRGHMNRRAEKEICIENNIRRGYLSATPDMEMLIKISVATVHGACCCFVMGLNQINITITCKLNLSFLITIYNTTCLALLQFCHSGPIFTCTVAKNSS